MKIFLCFCLFLSLSFKSYAQETDKEFERLYYTEKVEKYKRMKAGGIFFSIVGTSAMVYYASLEHTEEQLFQSMVSGACGIGSLALGIPTWIVGAISQNKYKKKLENMSVSVRVNPQCSGLTLTYRF